MVHIGHSDKYNVCLALKKILELLPYSAVVRSLDSSVSQEKLTKILKFHKIEYEIIENNVCLNFNQLEKGVNHGLFTGFDEVWLFRQSYPMQNLIDVPYSTADVMSDQETFDPETIKIFEEVQCDAILADGYGLYYVTRDNEVLETLR